MRCRRPGSSALARTRPRLLGQERPLPHPDLQLNRVGIAEQLAPVQRLAKRLDVQADRLND